MILFFVEPTPQSSPRPPLALSAKPLDWRRSAAVALAAAVTALLHGVVVVWYLQHPEPERVVAAVPLPMIDIALAAPSSSSPVPTPPVTPPQPPKPEPPKAQPKPKAKPKPVKKPKRPSEIKKPQVVKEPSPPSPAAAQPVVAPISPPAITPPVTGSHPDSDARQSQRSQITAASANADYLNNPKPNYPRLARQRYWQGRVVLRVLVTAEGRCGELSVYRSSGHELLDEAALAAVRQWRFVPGKQGDMAVASWVNVPIEFELD